MTWLDEILKLNLEFKLKISLTKIPTERRPGEFAIITCMDPRVNLEASGVKPFKANGESQSDIRVIRTLGGIAESRTLVVGIFLAGFKEVAIMMHTDCGCSLAYSKIDLLIQNLEGQLTPDQLSDFKNLIGEPFREKLRDWLHSFNNPRMAITDETHRLKTLSFIPANVIFHGLLYHLSSGEVEIVLNGYENN